jgi:hypothetical protein
MQRSIGAGFGLVAFLIVIALTLWMWSTYNVEVVKYGLPAEDQVKQFAGYDEQGKPAIQSIRLTPEIQNDKLKFVRVTSLAPQGAFEKWFHLQVNDEIIKVGPIELRNEDPEMALALIQESYQRQLPLIVVRGGQKIELPSGKVPGEGSLADANPSTQPTTKPAAQETVVPNELAPLRGLFK